MPISTEQTYKKLTKTLQKQIYNTSSLFSDRLYRNTINAISPDLVKPDKADVSSFYRIYKRMATSLFGKAYRNLKTSLVVTISGVISSDHLVEKLAKLMPIIINKIVQREFMREF